MPLDRLIKYLDENEKKYVVIKHSKAYTAQEVAASAHIPGKEMVKTVIVKADGEMLMVVLPSTHDVDFKALKKATGSKEIDLATEDEFQSKFPDCELGAMPPFGDLYDLKTLVAHALTEDERIAFNAGTHKELIQMSYQDYEELAKPVVLEFGVRSA